MTEWIYRADQHRIVHGDGDFPPDATEMRRLQSDVQVTTDGHWLATITLGDGESVSRLFDTEADARRYGDELAAWLSTERE